MTKPDQSLLRLVRAAIRMRDAIKVNHGPLPALAHFDECDQELREAAIAYTDGLSEHDRRRIGYGEKTRPVTKAKP